MKKVISLLGVIALVGVVSACSSPRRVTTTTSESVTVPAEPVVTETRTTHTETRTTP